MTFRGQCAFIRLASLLSTPGILRQNEGLPVGCVPDGPAKYFRVLGRFLLETFLRSACLKWPCQTTCSYAGYLDVSTLHTFKINKFLTSTSTNPGHRNFRYDIITHFFMRCALQDPTGYPRILDIIDLGPL
jgi:hypothetical protein